MGVEVVAVAEVDLADAVVRVCQLELDALELAVEVELGEVPVLVLEEPPGLVAVDPPGDRVLGVLPQHPHDDVVVVVAGGEDDPLALELVPEEVEERLGLFEGALHQAELDVEDVAKEDELVDVVEQRGEPLAGERPGEHAVGGPGPEVEIGDHEGSHAASLPSMAEYLHTCYRIGEIDRSVSFYEKLGFEERGRMNIGDEAINVFMGLPGDDPRLELTYNHGVDSYELGTGYNHIAVTVSDLDDTLSQLDAQGIQPEKPPYRVHEGGSRICFVRDPDGYRVELIERK